MGRPNYDLLGRLVPPRSREQGVGGETVVAVQSSRTSLRSATLWSYSLTIGKLAITTGLSFVLAAILGPRAYGVIAMALVYTGLMEMLQQQGMMPAIISRKRLDDIHADTAFWLVVGTSTVLTVAGVVLAPWWAAVNDLPELAPVIQVLAVGVLLASTVVVHEAKLRREMSFKKLAIRTWASVIAGGVAGIVGAALGWGVWALVAQQVVTSAVSVLVLWWVSPWRPRARVSLDAARELWSYSVRSASSSLALFVARRLDVVLVGLFFGPVVVGIYRMGQRLTQLVVDVTTRGMQSVSLPALSAVQDDDAAFSARLLTMQRRAASFAMPLLGVLAGLAPWVESVLGHEWSGTAIAIQLLAVLQLTTAAEMLLGPAMQARGRPGILSILLWLYGLLCVGALVVAGTVTSSSNELVVLCLAMIAANYLGSSIVVIVASRTLRVPLLKLTGSLLPGLLAGIVAAAATHFVLAGGATLPSILAGPLAALAGTAVALIMLLALDDALRLRLRKLVSATRRRSGTSTSAKEAQ